MESIKRLLECEAEITPSYEQENIPGVHSIIRKLPQELLDHIGCHSSVISHGNFVSAFGRELGRYDRSRVSLWTSIFKSDLWLQNMREKHNAQPVLIGSQLHELSKESYAVLYVCDAFRIPAGSWNLFRECLHGHTVMPNADIVLTTGVTLDVQTILSQWALQSILLSKHKQEKVFDFREGKPVFQYSFYETSLLHNLVSSDLLTGEQGWGCTLKLPEKGKVSEVICRIPQNCNNSLYEEVFKGLLVRAEKGE